MGHIFSRCTIIVHLLQSSHPPARMNHMALAEYVGQWAEAYADRHPDDQVHYESESSVPDGVQCLVITSLYQMEVSELDGVRNIRNQSFLHIWSDARDGTVGIEAPAFPFEMTIKKLWDEFSRDLTVYFDQTNTSLSVYLLVDEQLQRTTGMTLSELLGEEQLPVFQFQLGHGYPPENRSDIKYLRDDDMVYIGYHIEQERLETLFHMIPPEFYPEEIRANEQDRFLYFIGLVFNGWVTAVRNVEPNFMRYYAWFMTERQYERAYDAVMEALPDGLDSAIQVAEDLFAGDFQEKLQVSKWFQLKKQKELEERIRITNEWLSVYARNNTEGTLRLTDAVLFEPDGEGIFVLDTSSGSNHKHAFLWQLADDSIHIEFGMRVFRDTDIDSLWSIIEDIDRVGWAESTLTNERSERAPYLTLALAVDPGELDTALERIKEIDETVRERLGELNIRA